MRIATYNVNSIAARLPRLTAFLEDVRPDIVCLQETKVTSEGFPHLPLQAAGYVAADHSAGRWAGVAILARRDWTVEDVVTGLPGEAVPEEARWVEATVAGIRVVSTYVPNGQAIGSVPFQHKLTFLEAAARRAGELSGGPAVIAGDVNVCPSDLDVWDPALVHGATHVTADERSRLAAVIDQGFVDGFRALHPDEPGFTWWDYRAGAFHKAQGLRIDLALLDSTLATGLVGARVERDYRKPTKVPGSKPSDHAPLVIEVE